MKDTFLYFALIILRILQILLERVIFFFFFFFFVKCELKSVINFKFFMYVSINDCEKIMNNLWPFNLLAIFHLQTAI